MTAKKAAPTEAKMKRVGDYQPPQMEVDNFIDIEEVLDKDIIIDEFQVRESSTGEYLVVVGRFPGKEETIGFNCGGSVVRRKLEKAKNEGGFPLLGKISKPGRYYDII